MNTEQDYLVTYRFFDEKGRRLSIFSRWMKKRSVLIITVITCSKKDQFSKQYARDLFEEWRNPIGKPYPGEVHPIQLSLPIENNKPKYTFLKWCKENYFKKEKVIFAVESEMLMRGDELLDGQMGSFNIHPVFDGDSAPETNEN